MAGAGLRGLLPYPACRSMTAAFDLAVPWLGQVLCPDRPDDAGRSPLSRANSSEFQVGQDQDSLVGVVLHRELHALAAYT